MCVCVYLGGERERVYVREFIHLLVEKQGETGRDRQREGATVKDREREPKRNRDKERFMYIYIVRIYHIHILKEARHCGRIRAYTCVCACVCMRLQKSVPQSKYPCLLLKHGGEGAQST